MTRSRRLFQLSLLLPLAACGTGQSAPPDARSGTYLAEGGRIIVGDGTIIEEGAFLVEDGIFRAVGRAGEISAPPGVERIDLQGRTVIPALIDAHGHLGFEGYGSWSGANYTRANLIDHLERYAYYGFGAVASTGTDPEDLFLAMQEEQRQGLFGGARFLAAAGMAAPEAGPNPQMLREVLTLGPSVVRGVRTEEQARAAVREIAAKEIRFIKIWVDDRNGAQEKLPPPVYRAVIDEAHRHGIQVLVHQQTIEDTKELIRAGVDGFLHGRIGPAMDEEVIQLLARGTAFLVPNIGLGELRRERVFEDPFLQETVAPELVEQLRAAFQEPAPAPPEQEAQLRAAFTRLVEVDAQLVLGSDAGALPNHFFGYVGHRELEIFVRLGMTPMQAIVAATGRPAQWLGLDDLGTVETGKSADFVVLDADPLVDIRNTRRISRVFLRGEEVDRDRLRSRWTSGG